MVLKSTGLSFPAQPPDFANRVSRNAVSCSIILLKIYWTISVQYVKVSERFTEVKLHANKSDKKLDACGTLIEGIDWEKILFWKIAAQRKRLHNRQRLILTKKYDAIGVDSRCFECGPFIGVSTAAIKLIVAVIELFSSVPVLLYLDRGSFLE